jgi:hypothetical protein
MLVCAAECEAKAKESTYVKGATARPYATSSAAVAAPRPSSTSTLKPTSSAKHAPPGTAKLTTSHAYAESQYAGMDTPEISCWCFAATSRSLTMKTTKDAGMKEKAMTMKSTATKAEKEEMMPTCACEKGSGATVAAMDARASPASQESSPESTAATTVGAMCHADVLTRPA